MNDRQPTAGFWITVVVLAMPACGVLLTANADDTPQLADQKPLPVAEVIAADKDAVVLACEAHDDETGKPVVGAVVHITFRVQSDEERQKAGGEEQLWRKRMDAVTDAQGRYSVPIPAWAQERLRLHVRVEFEHPDYLRYWDNAPIGEILDEKDAGRAPPFRHAKMTRAREIVGRVLKPDGEPVANATLYKQYNKARFAFGPGTRDVRDNDFPQTGVDGRFRCKVAARGYVAVRFQAGPDLIDQPYIISAKCNQGDIRLSHGTRFVGRVLTSTDEPLKFAYVSVRFADDNFAPMSDCDAEGRFKTAAFGAGKHTVSVTWNGPDGKKAPGMAKDAPEVYLPVEVNLTGDEERHEITFRPVPHVQCVARIASAPARTGNDEKGLGPPVAHVAVTGEYQGRKWAANAPWFNHDLLDDSRDFVTIAPRGLTNAELSFLPLPQRVQLRKNAPLLFGDALRLAKLDADLPDLRIHCYHETTVKLLVKSPAAAPDDLTIEGQYAREPAMRAAGMVFRTSEAAMRKIRSDDGTVYYILPDEEVRFTIKAKGYKSVVEKLKLAEGASKMIEVALQKDSPLSPSEK